MRFGSDGSCLLGPSRLGFGSEIFAPFFDVAGNLKAMFAAIRAIGDDVRRPANVSCGSLLIDGMTLSGQ